ncbi:CDP-glycerol glycerophosphotransferase family protein [Lactococcus lactis]|uniref:CDP-glycerol glycerophosphotransferase family protein n=1 Tax=Lactococcus lactis TaxID=1358 RepID=UPI003D152C51
MFKIINWDLSDDKVFMEFDKAFKEDNILKLGGKSITYEKTSSNQIVVSIEKLKNAQIIYGETLNFYLNDNLLIYPEISDARENFRYFKIFEDNYLCFGDIGELSVKKINEQNLMEQFYQSSTIESERVTINDSTITVKVTKDICNKIKNILFYEKFTRTEVQYTIVEDEVIISVEKLQDIGRYKLIFDVEINNKINSFSLSSENINNHSDLWIVEGDKGVSLTTNALAINFDNRDIGVVDCRIIKEKFVLELISEEIYFEKIIAINQKTKEEFFLEFDQDAEKLNIRLDSLPSFENEMYYIQGDFFDIRFRFYMPQSKEKDIIIPDTGFHFYFSKNGRLALSNVQVKAKVGIEPSKEEEHGYQYFSLNDTLSIVSGCTTNESSIVNKKELYKYPHNTYLRKKLVQKNILEAIFQDGKKYQFSFNVDINIKNINAVHKKLKSKIPIFFIQTNKREVIIYLEKSYSYFDDIRAEYDIIFISEISGIPQEFIAGCSEMINQPTWARYYNAENVPNTPKNNIATRFYFDKKGKLNLLNRAILPTDEYSRNLPIKAKIESIGRQKDKINIELSYNLEELGSVKKYFKIRDAYLYKTINQVEIVNIEQIVDELDNKVNLSVSLRSLIDQNKLGHYVIVLIIDFCGKIFHIKINEVSEKYSYSLDNKRVVFSESINNMKRVVIPKLDRPKNFTLFIDDFKPVDNSYSLMLENRTVRKYQSKKFKEVKNKYIIFEKEGNYAQDNGFALFEWIQENIPENNTYYVINKNSPQLYKLEKYKEHVIYPGTYAYFKHLLTCSTIVGSENPIHLYDGDRASISPLMKKVVYKKQVVFLQHGVTALKNISKFKNFRADSNIIDYFVATNPEEKIIIHKYLGYEYFRIPVLGFTRWDKFEKNSKQIKDKILYVPTNRQWLVKATDDEFVKSDYYQGIVNLITNNDLIELLDENNLKFQVFVHPLMQKFTSTLMNLSPRIEVLSIENNDLGDLLRTADLLITDYSSVAWDFAVQHKPVLFYQFDREEYEQKIGSFVDLKNIPIGESYKSVSEVIEGIQKLKINHFEMNDNIRSQVNDLFDGVQGNVCEETYRFLEENN